MGGYPLRNKFDGLRNWKSGPTKKQLEIAREWKEKGIHQCTPTSMISTANEYEGPQDSVASEIRKSYVPKAVMKKKCKKVERKIWDLIEYLDEWEIDMNHFKTVYPNTYNDLVEKLNATNDTERR